MTYRMSMYQEYMDEYLIEATEEMKRTDKSDVYKETYYLRDTLQKEFITPILSKGIKRDSIIEFTGSFIDNHSTQLYTSGPIHMFTFADKETSFLYGLFDISKDKMLEMFHYLVKETYYGKISKPLSGLVENAPHKLLITGILVNALINKYDDIVECCEYLLGFCEYPLIYKSFWSTGADEEIMNYTIEHLQNRYKAKKLPNLLALLKYDMNSVVNLCRERLKTEMDYQYIDFIHRIRTQIKSTFKNISREYYKNHEQNATQHSRGGLRDDGNLTDSEGGIANIASMVENSYNKFIMSGINMPIIRVVSDKNQVDKDNVQGYVNQIMTSKNNRLFKFVENIITIYINNNPTNTSLESGDFLNFGLALYRRISSSKNPLFQEVSTIIDMWMNSIVNIKNQYTREGTIISYRRAIFDYMIFMINHHK